MSRSYITTIHSVQQYSTATLSCGHPYSFPNAPHPMALQIGEFVDCSLCPRPRMPKLDESTQQIVRNLRRIADAIEAGQAFPNSMHMTKGQMGPAIWSFEASVHKLP